MDSERRLDVTTEIDGLRRCNRPTKARGHCRQILTYPGDISCTIHATDDDKEIEDAYRRGWDAGYESRQGAYDSGVKDGLRQAEWAAHRAKMQAKEEANFRLEIDGDQIVCIGKYGYRWVGEGPPLEIGDRVWVPGNWLVRHATIGFVTSLGSSYTGEFSYITRRASAEALV